MLFAECAAFTHAQLNVHPAATRVQLIANETWNSGSWIALVLKWMLQSPSATWVVTFHMPVKHFRSAMMCLMEAHSLSLLVQLHKHWGALQQQKVYSCKEGRYYICTYIPTFQPPRAD